MSWQLIHFIRSQFHLVMGLWLLLIKFAMNSLENLIQHAFNKTHQFWNTTRITRLVPIKISIFIYHLERMTYKKFRSLLSRVHGRPVERWMQMCSSLLRFVHPFYNHLRGLSHFVLLRKSWKTQKRDHGDSRKAARSSTKKLYHLGACNLCFTSHSEFQLYRMW